MATSGGIPTHVEESGSGPTLYYLHGCAEWAGYAAPLTSLLARSFRVVEPERRGHGRTPDVAGPITYEAMAGDTAALLEHFEDTPATLVGYSDGGIVALLLAIRHPELVGRIVAIGPNARVDGLTAETLAELRGLTPATWPAEVREAYERLSPDGPDHWPVVSEKLRHLLLTEPDLSAAELGTVAAPTLLVGGDRDAVRLEHLVELHRAIPGSQLCILPDAPHELPLAEPERVAELVTRFVSACS